jgi:hypothetical protein
MANRRSKGRTDLIEMRGPGRRVLRTAGGFAIERPRSRVFRRALARVPGLTSLDRNFALFKVGESRRRTGVAARILRDMTNF